MTQIQAEILRIIEGRTHHMAYKIRPGIVRVRICGKDLLVAKRSVWEECPRVRIIPKLWAACWAVMENDRTDQDVVAAFAGLLNKSEDEVRERFDKIFRTLYDENYLIKTEERTP